MTPDHHRLRFHTWLVESGLDADTADAILMTMSPFDWHELATKKDLEQFATKADLERFPTKADLEQLRSEMATKAEVAELRTEMRDGFASIRDEMRADRAIFQTEMGTLRTEMATIRREGLLILLALVGFMLSILASGWVPS